MEKLNKDSLMGWGALAGIVAIAVSTVLQYNIATDPQARAKAFTSDDGAVHDSRITNNAEQLQLNEHALISLRGEISGIISYLAKLESTCEAHLQEFVRHEARTADMVREFSIADERHETLISECLARTRRNQ